MPVTFRCHVLIRGAALAALASAIAVAARAADAPRRVEATVAPRLSYAPTSVRVSVTIEPQPQNRRAIVELESVEIFQASEFQLDGDRAPRVRESTYANLPSGHYVVRVRLIDADGHEAVSTTHFQVLSRS
jgi:hypothetical protein